MAVEFVRNISHYKGIDCMDNDLYPGKEVKKALVQLLYLTARSDNCGPSQPIKNKSELRQIARINANRLLREQNLVL